MGGGGKGVAFGCDRCGTAAGSSSRSPPSSPSSHPGRGASSVALMPWLYLRHAATEVSDLGQWTGLSRCEIERGWPGWVDAWRRRQLADPPGGETDQQVAARVARALR